MRIENVPGARPSPARDDITINHNEATRNCGIYGRHKNSTIQRNAELWDIDTKPRCQSWGNLQKTIKRRIQKIRAYQQKNPSF